MAWEIYRNDAFIFHKFWPKFMYVFGLGRGRVVEFDWEKGVVV